MPNMYVKIIIQIRFRFSDILNYALRNGYEASERIRSEIPLAQQPLICVSTSSHLQLKILVILQFFVPSFTHEFKILHNNNNNTNRNHFYDSSSNPFQLLTN